MPGILWSDALTPCSPDLDLDHFCELIGQELHEIVAHPNPNLDWVQSADNQPFGPYHTASAVDIVGGDDGVHGFHRDCAKHHHNHATYLREHKRTRAVEVFSI